MYCLGTIEVWNIQNACFRWKWIQVKILSQDINSNLLTMECKWSPSMLKSSCLGQYELLGTTRMWITPKCMFYVDLNSHKFQVKNVFSKHGKQYRLILEASFWKWEATLYQVHVEIWKGWMRIKSIRSFCVFESKEKMFSIINFMNY